MVFHHTPAGKSTLVSAISNKAAKKSDNSADSCPPSCRKVTSSRRRTPSAASHSRSSHQETASSATVSCWIPTGLVHVTDCIALRETITEDTRRNSWINSFLLRWNSAQRRWDRCWGLWVSRSRQVSSCCWLNRLVAEKAGGRTSLVVFRKWSFRWVRRPRAESTRRKKIYWETQIENWPLKLVLASSMEVWGLNQWFCCS